MRRFLTLFTVLMLCGVFAFAQSRVVSGKVTDNDGNAVPYASVKIQGKKTGVAADATGAYSIKVNAEDVLVFSSANFEQKTVTVGAQNSIFVSLSRSTTNTIQEVVVTTALNVKRKADNLSYASQGLTSEKLTTVRNQDLNNALAGKIAGVQVRSESGAKLGSAGTIRLRGVGSITKDNNPLYIVDGTPIDDANDINTDDIEDVQVLKGPTATALYGQRADAGVLMITTKKAKRRPGLGIEFSSSAIYDQVSIVPRYQNEYSGGTGSLTPVFNQFNWDASMPAEWKALDGKYYHTYFDDASWGPRMAGQEYIPWYAWIPGSEYSFKTAKLTPQPNNVRDFWNKGTQLINNVAVSKAGNDYSFRISYTDQDQTGLLPYSYFKKHFVNTSSSVDLNSHLTVGLNLNYYADKKNGDFDDTYGNQATGSFSSWFHRDLDMNILKQLQGLRTPTGLATGWNLDDQNGITNKLYNGTLFWSNYYTYYNVVKAVTERNKIYGDLNFTYKFNSHFKVTGAFRKNQLNTNFEGKVPTILEKSTSDGSSPLSYSNAQASTDRPIRATYTINKSISNEDNYELNAFWNDKFGKLGVDVMVGGNIRKNSNSYINTNTNGGLVVEDLFTLSNSLLQPFYYDSKRYQKRVNSLYARSSLNWNDIFILDLSVRNDISSALPVNKNSYTYPSVGGSLILTSLFKSMPVISFVKLRGSWAQVGSDLDPYGLDFNYVPGTTQWNGNQTMTTPDLLVDPNIQPSLSSAYEGGIDLRFLKNRISFSGTYYDQKKRKDIIDVAVVGASGFAKKRINAGEIEKSGIELSLDLVPIRTKNFQWDISLNFAKEKSQINSIYPGIPILYQGGSDYTSSTGATALAPGVWSVEGGQWGQLRGTGIQKINGVNVIDPATGLYVAQQNVNFGSVLPDYTGGGATSIRFHNFTLTASIDFAKGGKYYSLSDFWGKYSGLLQETASKNDKGNSVRDLVADGGGVHVFGVDATGKPVDKYVEGLTYFQQFYNQKINENSVFDLDYVKVRELSLGYKIPVKSLGKLGNFIQSAQFSVLVKNPFMIYSKNKNLDPSELVGSYGESGQFPATRSTGVTLKVAF